MARDSVLSCSQRENQGHPEGRSAIIGHGPRGCLSGILSLLPVGGSRATWGRAGCDSTHPLAHTSDPIPPSHG